MRTFVIIWLGQLVSTVGSQMTGFAVGIWVWERTGSVTALAGLGLASQLPRIALSLYAGVLADRYSRQGLIILSDCVAAASTVALGALFWAQALQLWHLYLVWALNSGFSLLQNLSYSASVAMLVPQAQYARAASMNSVFHYGSATVAPAIAGVLYPLVGLAGILAIDWVSFGVAIATLATQRIPQPERTDSPPAGSESVWQRFGFGFRYLRGHGGLAALLAATSLFWLAHDLGGALLRPLVLARTDSDATVLGWVYSAAGVAGVLSAAMISTRGAPQRKLNGLFGGMMGTGVCKTVFGLAQTPLVWIPAQFGSSLNFPLMRSTNDTIWLNEVDPAIQGRVFSVRSLSRQVVGALGLGIAGPLADYAFKPAMQADGWLTPLLGDIFGTGEGAGIALLYVLSSLCLLLVGIGSQLAWRQWHAVRGWDALGKY